MSNIRPLNDTVIIEPDPYRVDDPNPEMKRIIDSGIIILPDKNSLQKRSPFATIVSCGPACRYGFLKGQKILIDRTLDSGTPIFGELNGKKIRFIREYYIMAVLE